MGVQVLTGTCGNITINSTVVVVGLNLPKKMRIGCDYIEYII